jgi:hypothetical protein
MTSKKNSSDSSNSSSWLSPGIICVLIAGALAAKSVFVVDNSLEIKTEFSAKIWQDNLQSVRNYTIEIGKLAYQSIVGGEVPSEKMVVESIDTSAKQLYQHTSKVLTDRKTWCGAASEVSTLLANAKNLNSTEMKKIATNHPDLISKVPIEDLYGYINPEPQLNQSIQNLCITSGGAKK